MIAHSAMPPKMVTVYACHCPLKCKGTSRLGTFSTFDQAHEKCIHHLINSSLHYMQESEAAEVLDCTADKCIWEEEAEEAEVEEPAAKKIRLRSPVRPTRASSSAAGSRCSRRSPSPEDRSHRKDRAGVSSEAIEKFSGKLRRTVQKDHEQQKQEVFNFAKCLGKCEAVIRTASRVARQAANAFEDNFDLLFIVLQLKMDLLD